MSSGRSRSGNICFRRYEQGLVSQTIGRRPSSLASAKAAPTSFAFSSAVSARPLLSNG